MKDLYEKHIKSHLDIITYVFWGIITTIVNLAVYHLCFNTIHLEYYSSSIIAWVVTIITVYITNRKWVFHSSAKGIKEITEEFIKFTTSRLITLALEVVFLYIGRSILSINEDITKYLTTIIIVIINYIFSKLFVFVVNSRKINKAKKA